MRCHKEVSARLKQRLSTDQKETKKGRRIGVTGAAGFIGIVALLIVLILVISTKLNGSNNTIQDSKSAEPIREIKGLGGDSEAKGVYFYVSDTRNPETEDVKIDFDEIANTLMVVLQKEKGTVEYGTLIPVYGISRYYYIPVFFEGKCYFLLSYGETEDGEGIVSFFDSCCEQLNDLSDGAYCFVKYDNGVFLQGEGICIPIEAFGEERAQGTPLQLPTEEDELSPFLRVCHGSMVSEDNTRSIISNELTTVPFVSNYNNSACWLSCAVSICKYYGNSSLTMSTAHGYAHNDHSLTSCQSGSINDGLAVITHATSFSTGTVTGNQCNAAKAMFEINQGRPVYSSWEVVNEYYGHAMVICGYLFDNTSGSFTYILMDPDYSSRRYATSTYSASPVVLSINTGTPSSPDFKSLKWEQAIYDLQ